MGTTVQIKNSRLIIKKDGRLVSDRGGDFLDADTNDRFIVILLQSGRVQLLRLDGQFIKDISARADLTRIKIMSDDTVTWKEQGREIKCNVSNCYNSSTININNKTFKTANNAEEVGAALANFLIEKIKFLFIKIYEIIKNK